MSLPRPVAILRADVLRDGGSYERGDRDGGGVAGGPALFGIRALWWPRPRPPRRGARR